MNLPLADGRVMSLDRPLIMGILNVTPDSFSDGGTHSSEEAALVHARAMIEEGADIIDVGGESTRPGSRPVPEEEQRRRVVNVIRQLRNESDRAGKPIAIGIDTTLLGVAAAALDAGAAIINDVSAGRGAGMLELAAERRCPIVLMHMQGTPETMQVNPAYHDVVAEVEAFLLERAAAARRAGVAPEAVILDPGIGFGKTKEHNLALLANLSRLVAAGFPGAVMLGTSRKRFMGSICRGKQEAVVQPHELVGATCATTALGVVAGVRIFRVHDVQANRQAADVAWAVKGENTRGEDSGALTPR